MLQWVSYVLQLTSHVLQRRRRRGNCAFCFGESWMCCSGGVTCCSGSLCVAADETCVAADESCVAAGEAQRRVSSISGSH